MTNYISQEEAIYTQATQRGVSHDVVYDYFDKTIDHVTAQHPGKSSDDRLGKAEELVWRHFFPDARFPGKKSTVAPIIKMESTIENAPHAPSSEANPAKIEKEYEDESEIQVDASESFIKTEPLESIGKYASQAKLITSKAAILGLQRNEFQAIFKEKMQIAENRFPGESPDWQTWFAESMVWSFYLKDEAFPGKEPPRLFPLRSTFASESTTYKSPTSSEGKWVKFADSGLPIGTGANSTMIDSYRPNLSRIRTSTDRGVPLAVDSYRPGATSTNRSVTSGNSSGTTLRPLTPAAPLNRSPSVNNSAGQGSSAYTYMPQEKVMEKKAIALGIRREFFQYLQRMRDRVRADHPDCSSQYRHWAADTMVWARFFKRQPFPAAEPRGGDRVELHARQCPMFEAYESSNRSERKAPVAPTSKFLTSSGVLTAVPPPKAVAPAAATKSSNPSQKFSEPQSENAPPLALALELSSKRLNLQPTISKQTRAIMVNKNITWTTAASVERIAGTFTRIDPTSLDLVENDLKVHLRFCSLSSGDIILWSEAFLADDVAFERGGKFLMQWFDLNHPGPLGVAPLSFANCWKHFKESEKLDLNLSRKLNGSEKLDLDHSRQFSDSKKRVNINVQPVPAIKNLNHSDSISDLPNLQAAENDWEKYASKFQATDLDRLMIEEAAKVEGLMRMVCDEVSGHVITLGEYARRVMNRANRSVEVSDFAKNLLELRDNQEDNRSKELSNSERVGKRKAENDDEDDDAPVEKRAKV